MDRFRKSVGSDADEPRFLFAFVPVLLQVPLLVVLGAHDVSILVHAVVIDGATTSCV